MQLINKNNKEILLKEWRQVMNNELKYGIIIKTIFYSDGIRTTYSNGYEELLYNNYRKLYKIEDDEKVLIEYEEFNPPNQ